MLDLMSFFVFKSYNLRLILDFVFMHQCEG